MYGIVNFISLFTTNFFVIIILNNFLYITYTIKKENYSMKNIKVSTLIIAILIPLAVGSISAYLSRGGMELYIETINKPPLSPPAAVFPVVWTILYILMGISSYMVYVEKSPFRERALKWYAIQLFINFFWSIIFFRIMKFLPAFVWLVALICAIGIMILYFLPVRRAAAYLQIPYLLWCIFAAYLNLGVWILN